LARAGRDVLLLDRALFPRDKPCGEFLTPETERSLQGLGAWDRVSQAGLAPIGRVVLHSHARGRAEFEPTGQEKAGWAIRRSVLDDALLAHAASCGVEVRQGVGVCGLVYDGDLVCGVKTGSTADAPIRTRLVVGADGTHSVVARKLGLVRPMRRLQRIALVSHWRGVDDTDAIEMRARDRTVCGYGALGSRQANVTLVVPTIDAPQVAGRAAEFLEQRIEELFPDLAQRLSGAKREAKVTTVGCFGHTCRRAAVGGAMLIGDAATFIDPFTGEGIYFALRGAELAAEVADSAFRRGVVHVEALAPYDRLRKELHARYLLCGLVQTVVRTPRLMNRAVLRLASSPPLMDRLMTVLGDQRPPRDVMTLSTLRQLFA
jgi:menaquinone-9 beta-reductase